jgi:hypothetical protein
MEVLIWILFVLGSVLLHKSTPMETMKKKMVPEGDVGDET